MERTYMPKIEAEWELSNGLRIVYLRNRYPDGKMHDQVAVFGPRREGADSEIPFRFVKSHFDGAQGVLNGSESFLEELLSIKANPDESVNIELRLIPEYVWDIMKLQYELYTELLKHSRSARGVDI